MIPLSILMGLLLGCLLNWASDYLPRMTFSDMSPLSGATPPVHASSHLLKTSGPWRTLARVPEFSWLDVGVEIFSASLFAYLGNRLGLSWRSVLVALILFFFLLIAVIDIKHQLILNVLIYPAMVIALLLHSIFSMEALPSALLGGAVGLGPFLLTGLVRPGRIGAGDIKLAALIGLSVGFPQVLWALTVGILSGGFVAFLLLLTSRYEIRDRMPYAPFLCLGVIVTFLYDPFRPTFFF